MGKIAKRGGDQPNPTVLKNAVTQDVVDSLPETKGGLVNFLTDHLKKYGKVGPQQFKGRTIISVDTERVMGHNEDPISMTILREIGEMFRKDEFGPIITSAISSGTVWQFSLLRNLALLEALDVKNGKVPYAEFAKTTVGKKNKGSDLDFNFSPRTAQKKSLLHTDALPRQVRSFTEARKVARENFVGKSLKNTATGIEAVVSGKTLGKMLSEKAVAKSESARVQAMAVANLDSLFERAILGWTKPDRDKSADIAGVHRFFTPMDFEGKYLVAKLTVKETIRPTDNNTL